MDRDEAIKVIREYYPSSGKDLNEALETLIPELKESEDERIRKELIRIFKSLGDGKIPVDINYADIFAWLEKQGEHIKFLESIQIGDEVTRNPDGVLVNLSQFKRKAEQGSQILANSAKTCKVEQKPAWSEEDEKMYTATTFALAGFMGNEDKLDWLKSLKERYTWKPSDEQIKALELAIGKYPLNGEVISILGKLYNDLKKLK